MSGVTLNPFSLVLLFVAGIVLGVLVAFRLVSFVMSCSASAATEAMQAYSKMLGLGAWIRFARHWAVIECPKCGYADVVLPGEAKDDEGCP